MSNEPGHHHHGSDGHRHRHAGLADHAHADGEHEHRIDGRLDSESEIELRSVGIDIGSATAQLLFSTIRLVKLDSRFVTVSTTVDYASAVYLTPYLDDSLIDTELMRSFFDEQYERAGVDPNEIDAGSIIFTGTALRKRNSRRLAELFSAQAGRLVAVGAGDQLESVLAAHGGGAVALSGQRRACVLNIDIGGGTTKLSLCQHGRVLATTALDVGARLVVVGADNVAVRVEPAAARIARTLGVPLAEGAVVDAETLDALATYMIEQVVVAATLTEAGPDTADLLRQPAILGMPPVELVALSGGVSEYAAGRVAADADFGDIGRLLAQRLTEQLAERGVVIVGTSAGIRATVVGASQFATQVSGDTIYVSEPGAVPVRNAPVLACDYVMPDEIQPAALAASIVRAMAAAGLPEDYSAVAIALRWSGMATFARLAATAEGIVDGLGALPHPPEQIVVVTDDDIGRLLGRHVARRLGEGSAVVSIDCVELRAFDYIDVGAVIPGSGAVPVVIKSLLFGVDSPTQLADIESSPTALGRGA